MTDSNADRQNHDRNVKVIARSVAGLAPQFRHMGLNSVQILEGAIKGAAVSLVTDGATGDNIADLLEDIAGAFRDLPTPDNSKPNLRLVQ
ncbi:hypothetical protein [Maricaulis sp.]|uniref:hypothetical protein n=1 Tax=Maricaulis sp. TaxID=1486257 RepID=UPI003A943F0E